MRLVIAAALAGAALAPPAPAVAQQASIAIDRGETLLEVEARGTHLARPDVMTIRAGVATTGQQASSALQANSALTSRVLEAIRSRVAARDVSTKELRVQPRFSREGDTGPIEPRITGYVALNTVEVRIRDLAAAPALIDAMLRAGANTIEGPRFALSDERAAKEYGRRKAIEAAREQAETYASAMGMRIGRVLRVSERRSWIEAGRGDIVVTGTLSTGTPIEPGEIATEVIVWVDYALVPK